MTPAKTRAYESLIREATALQHPLVEPYNCELYAILNLRFINDHQGDIDNIEKSIWDGMQGVAYKNDRQIKRVDKEIIIEPDMPPYIEVILLRHRRRLWQDRLSPEILEFLSQACPF
jgi:Holliday junction resolvase RusA-like endonuclease